MTETRAPYYHGTFGTLWDHPPAPSPAPPPDTVLTALEAIREVVHDELVRIERDGGCGDGCGPAWLRVEALVGRVLR